MKKTMSGLYSVDNWETFLAQPERVPSWKIPFNIAVALHLVVFAGAVVLPDAGKRPEMDNVVVVDLLSLPLAAPAPEVEQQAVMPQAKKKEFPAQQPEPVQPKQVKAPDPVPEAVDSKPEVIEKVVKTPDPVPEIAPEPKIRPQSIAQAKPVSLRPLKRKKKLAEDVRLAEVKEQEAKKKQQYQERQERQAQLAALERKRLVEQRKREQAAEEEKRRIARKKKQQQVAAKRRQAELLADQRRREREIAEAARLARQAEQAAEQARLEAAALKREYASVSQAVSSLNTPISSRASWGAADSRGGWAGNGVYSGSGSEQGNPAVLKQYIASLHGRISSNWQLPEILKKKPHLRAMVALTIGRDGFIKDMRIERKSGNTIFDQSVLKALQSSAPFPDFPVLIDKSTLEFALNFTPQGLAF
ncbi:cell envelope integrity protein TolA [Candidatus Electrothrix sp.]|uniref:cell envelope integrity protein TolA n=1 Tax=Candidatus Electrothrix sp. TaxID=2170559 RepID=UPI0040577A97